MSQRVTVRKDEKDKERRETSVFWSLVGAGCSHLMKWTAMQVMQVSLVIGNG